MEEDPLSVIDCDFYDIEILLSDGDDCPVKLSLLSLMGNVCTTSDSSNDQIRELPESLASKFVWLSLIKYPLIIRVGFDDIVTKKEIMENIIKTKVELCEKINEISTGSHVIPNFNNYFALTRTGVLMSTETFLRALTRNNRKQIRLRLTKLGQKVIILSMVFNFNYIHKIALNRCHIQLWKEPCQFLFTVALKMTAVDC